MDDRDEGLEHEIRITDIAHRHAVEFYNQMYEIACEIRAGGSPTPISVDYVEEMFRCAIEEAVGDEDRQRPKGHDPLVDRFPYV